MNTTILYYSSGREKPDFEKRIIDSLLEVSGELPIVSVTQKPMKLGNNICVGDVGASGFNLFRQIFIGLKAITTKFVISAEADSLYPKGYFDFIPERDDVCYRATKIYVMPDARDYFFHKVEGTVLGQIVGRDFYLSTLEKLFEGAPQWSAGEKNFPKERHRQADIFTHIERWDPPAPIVTFKTHRGLRFFTHSDRIPILEIPYWGDGKSLRAYYFHGTRKDQNASL
jgi:hypothetical protein